VTFPVERFTRMMMWREAVASVALSHPETCDCRICQAASGDEDAMTAVVAELMDAPFNENRR